MEKKQTVELKSHSKWSRIIRILIPVIVLAAGFTGAAYIKNSAPRPKRQRPPEAAPLVHIKRLQLGDEQVYIQAMGTVIPAREIVLESRVSGAVIWIHPEFIEGGFLNEGDEVLRIDAADYELTVEQQKSRVADADYALKVEMGRQEVAKREWQMLKGGKKINSADDELALRKPHLAKAEADLKSAEAELAKAELNLKRTQIKAPFNAFVRTKKVDVGSQVSAGEPLAELVGTDEFRVRAAVPLDRLKWITIPKKIGDTASTVRIIHGLSDAAGHERIGTVVKLIGELDAEGRMANVLISINDPLNRNASGKNPGNLEKPPLLIGEFVRTAIEGAVLDHVFRVPRTALRDGNNVWIATTEGQVDIRRVKPVWRDPDSVFLQDGVSEGEQLIISDIPSAVGGMKIRVVQTAEQAEGEKILLQ